MAAPWEKLRRINVPDVAMVKREGVVCFYSERSKGWIHVLIRPAAQGRL